MSPGNSTYFGVKRSRVKGQGHESQKIAGVGLFTLLHSFLALQASFRKVCSFLGRGDAQSSHRKHIHRMSVPFV